MRVGAVEHATGPMTDDDHPSHRLFAACYDPVMWGLERAVLPPHRRYLARDSAGRVLDLGCGTGAMFPYIDGGDVGDDGEDAELHAIEPDPHMLKRAERRAAAAGLDVEIRQAGAEDLPYDDGTFDIVIASMVFCTIPDVDAALEEVARVLRPGGEFRFLEHVHGDGLRRRLQDAVAPAWCRLAGGCRVNRATGERIAAHPAFAVADLETLDVGVGVVRPFVRGTVRRVVSGADDEAGAETDEARVSAGTTEKGAATGTAETETER